MGDLKADGTVLEVKPSEPSENKQTTVTEQPANPELRAPAGMLELTPSYVKQGNELVLIVKMLESINKNLAFMAQTIHLHLNPEVKDGRHKA